MEDRELLELAAKAAGYTDIDFNGPYPTRVIGHDDDFDCNVYTRWNPLTDDGDALRLAVRLRIDLYFNEDAYLVQANPQNTRHERCEQYGKDMGAVTRRAIVHAAAAIGTSIK